MSFFNKVKKVFESSESINTGNFKYLDELIHSGVKNIDLTSDIVLESNEKNEYLGGIKLDIDDLVIDGKGYAIDAKGKTRIFECYGKNIVIKNITLKNGFTKEMGGAIRNKSSLTLVNSLFEKNKSKLGGGAIHNDGKLIIKKSRITENTAQGKHFPDNNRNGGGAIFNTNILTIIKTSLYENNAIHGGGAIHNKGGLRIIESSLNDNISKFGGGAIKNSNDLTIIKSTFSENIAKNHSGGVIYNLGVLNIEDSSFSNNHTKDKFDGGGAIYNLRKLNIVESTFNENTSTYGGAITNLGESNIEKSTFSKNKVKDLGGAVANEKGYLKLNKCLISENKSPNDTISNTGALDIYNTFFINNQNGCVIVNWGDKSNLSVIYSEFRENIVKKSVIYNMRKSTTIQKTIFENNLSKGNSYNIINKSDLILIDPRIDNASETIRNDGNMSIKNSSKDFETAIGGECTIETDTIPQGEKFDFGKLDVLIHESEFKEITLENDTCFENYERDYYEGGIELDIDNLIIDGNGKTIDGNNKSRIFIISGKNITLKNIIFKNGYSHKNYHNPLNAFGGAIKINYNRDLKIENCKFINNTSEGNGGAIYNRESNLNLIKSTFNGNVVNGENRSGGGAIYNNKGDLKITDSTLNSNTANGDKLSGGGAIYNNKGDLKITDSTLNSNTANGINYNSTQCGGAIYNNKGDLKITDSIFNSNTVNGEEFGDGGAIHNEKGNLTIVKSEFRKNIVNGRWNSSGGAIKNEMGRLYIFQSSLIENHAKMKLKKPGIGGAIFNSDAKEFKIENCILEKNKPNDI